MKLALDRRSFRIEKRGVVVFLVLWGFLLAVGLVLLFRGPVDSYVLAFVFDSAAMLLLAIADLVGEAASDPAVLLKLVANLLGISGLSFVAVGIHLDAGILWATVFVGAVALALLAVFYLQRKQNGTGGRT